MIIIIMHIHSGIFMILSKFGCQLAQ